MVEGCAEPGILAPIQADIGPDVVLIANLRPPRAKRRAVHCHPTTDNCHEPTSRFYPQQSLFQVPGTEGCLVTAHPAAGGREGRIHHDGIIVLFRRQQIIQPLSIECPRFEALERQ